MMSTGCHIHNSVRRIPEELKEKWVESLSREGIESPHVTVREIEKYVIKKMENVQHRTLSFERMCTERLKRKPLQYIIGEWDFRYLTLKMKEPVFICRPETEGFVDLIKEEINNFIVNGNEGMKVLEIGCGSGAISLSLLHEIKNISCVAIDIFKDAIDLTLENAQRYDLHDERLKIYHANLVDFPSIWAENERFDLIISNPPYIPTEDVPTLQDEVVKFESIYALDGGPDGLEPTRNILRISEKLLKPNGSIWLELGEQHPVEMPGLTKEFPNHQLKATYKDCFGKERFYWFKMSPENKKE